MNEEELLKRLREAFRLEADERLANMSSGLLALEKTSDPDGRTAIVEEIFREAHSLKGAARAVNLKEIETLSQSTESVLAGMKKGDIPLRTELFDVLHDSVTAFENFLLSVDGDPGDSKKEISGVMERLADWKDGKFGIGEKTTEAAPKAEKKPETPKVEKPIVPQLEDVDDFDDDEVEDLSRGLKTQQPEIFDEEPSAPPAQASSELPEPQSPEPEAPKSPEPEASKSPDPTVTPTVSEPAAVRTQMADTVRIATSKLDSILLKAEELVSLKLVSSQHSQNLRDTSLLIEQWDKKWTRFKSEMRWLRREVQKQEQSADGERGHSQLSQLLEFLDWNKSHIMDMGHEIRTLTKASEQDHRNLSRFADDLLDEVKRVTMLPFSTLFDGFPRMIRDISRNQNKQVDLVLQGGEIEIDRRILEEMKSPFIHLLRNSVDHGLEDPALRAEAGKPDAGVISLTVSQDEGGKVEIVLEDDGGGIDCESLKEKALKKGIISAKEVESMSDQDAVGLIFKSEISTSPIITEISGRGLGMAIVAETVEKLGGLLFVEAVSGKGTKFTIRLPVTLATFRGVLIESEAQQFIIPGAQMERVLRLPRNQIKTVESKASVKVNGQVLSVADLGGVLSLDTVEKPKDKMSLLTLLILGAGDMRMAFSVDQVVCEQEVVVKSLGKQLARVPNVSGATILGSGKVAPVLNVSDLMKSAARAISASSGAALEGDKAGGVKKSILIAEDSITSRMLIKNILEAAGYEVQTAVDGLEAYKVFEDRRFDAVVSDVEMPRMNGFQLTAKIREHEVHSEIPVVLVTSLDSREDKEKGIEAGANAYIVKASFDQSNLLEVIDRLI